MPDAVSEKFVRSICAVFHMGQVPGFEKAFVFLPGNPEHRPYQVPPYGSNAPKAFEARAAYQVEKHRLCVIVSRMGRGNFAGERRKVGIPRFSGGGFQALFAGDHPSGAYVKGNVVPITEFPDEIFIPVRFCSPEMVVKVDGFQMDAQLVL